MVRPEEPDEFPSEAVAYCHDRVRLSFDRPPTELGSERIKIVRVQLKSPIAANVLEGLVARASEVPERPPAYDPRSRRPSGDARLLVALRVQDN